MVKKLNVGNVKLTMQVRVHKKALSHADDTPETVPDFFFFCPTLRRSDCPVQIWDTAGQERFRSMAPMYYRNAAAAILVMDWYMRRRIHVCHMRRRIHVSYEEEDTCITVTQLLPSLLWTGAQTNKTNPQPVILNPEP